jgi:NADH:ubiquinone oxidoreductase subunit 3 (subunit A)
VLFDFSGAALGGMVFLLAFDIGLVLVTAWVGASAILDSASQVLTKGSTISMVIFIVLLLAGIGVQLNRSVRLAK